MNVPVDVGEPFPKFTAPNQDGEQITLEDYRGNDKLVVFFYPRAGTSG
jgi:thioredoxin-dependent peroxiredoxin